ncbi:hypothetical protein L0244_02970 [bacterium]|nr:hypothetical protein [bacterium]
MEHQSTIFKNLFASCDAIGLYYAKSRINSGTSTMLCLSHHRNNRTYELSKLKQGLPFYKHQP